MNPQFEQHLQIDGHLSVSDEDRRPYTKMFEHIKKWLIREMRQVDKVFDKLCKGTSSYDTYTNGVHRLYPYEFDIFFIMEFPFDMQVGLDDDRPGFVHLDLKDALAGLKMDPNNRDVYESLSRLVDSNNGYLRRSNFQDWIGSIITKAFKTCSCDSGYDITYQRNAEAHNIWVCERSQSPKKISIDFVPALTFGHVWWMRELENPVFKDDYRYSSYAVPKAANKSPHKTNMYTFLMVNPLAEHELLWDKPNLKIVFRLLKSLIYNYEVYNLKSYFLTNVFLWEVESAEKNFWDRPVNYIFLHMLDKLCEYFYEGELPFFWVPDWNLLDILDVYALEEYTDTLFDAWSVLETYPIQPLLSYTRTSSHFDLSE